jgi:RimJ/RimL family protein N-acetyltransferase
MTHPRVYPHITDDNSPAPELFEPVDHDAIVYLHAQDEYGTLGIFMLVPQSAVCYQVHTCMLPQAWGAPARDAARLGTQWMFDHGPCRRIVTNVPEYNRIAERFARACGMAEYGRNLKSFLKDGVLYDEILLGISKE